MWIATAQHSRDIDQRSVDDFGLSALVLMERAGLSVFAALREMLPDGGRITAVCGKGNNGGDGFVVARLAHQHGYLVECLVSARAEEMREDAAHQYKQACAQGVCPLFVDDPRWEKRLDTLCSRDLIVDAVLGIGATGEVTGPALEAIEAINRSGVPVISIDVPSGIHADTGDELGESVWANRTVTMGQPKPFLFQGLGLEHSGDWSVADIGYPRELMRTATDAMLLDRRWVAGLVPERLKSSHKGDQGSILIVGGSHSMRGAIALATKAALRTGAGLVTVAGIESVCETVMQHCPEAILMPLPERDGVIDPHAALLLLENESKYDAALFGPGMTHADPVQEFLASVWEKWETPSVLDADALNAAANGVKLPNAECILTPHPGEMSRLLHTTVAEVQNDRFETARAACEQLGQTVLLKGPYSIVAKSGEPILVNPTGNSGMACAGMGDVLSGMITTLMGQELPPIYAGAVAMHWHGLAGDLCAERFGAIGFTARDVAQSIPQARAKLLSLCSGC